MSPRPLFSADDIATRVDALAADAARNLPPDVVVVGILVAAFVFTADLVRALGRHGMRPRIDFLRLASYGDGRIPHATPEIQGPIPRGLHGAHVLVVDTVLDSGRTLARALEIVRAERPQHVVSAVLVDKPGRRTVDVTPDLRGFTADGFLVGYGLDDGHGGRWRPDIAVVDA